MLDQFQTLNVKQVDGSSVSSRYYCGWTTDGVGQGYGSGYPISMLQGWLEKAI